MSTDTDTEAVPLPILPEETKAMITVRLPAALHRQLLDAAHERGMSLNKLCIEKLRELATGSLI